MGSRNVRVAGVTYDNEDGTSRQRILLTTTKYTKIYLKDEASEKYPEAIAVYTEPFDEKIGFIPSYLARDIRSWGITDFRSIDARIVSIGSSYGKPIGVEIYLYHPLIKDYDFDASDATRVRLSKMGMSQSSVNEMMRLKKEFAAIQSNSESYSKRNQRRRIPYGTIILIGLGMLLGWVIVKAIYKF